MDLTHILLSYGISWLYFFFTVRIAIHIFGKYAGVAINYIISWLVLFAFWYFIGRVSKADEEKN